MALDQLRLDTCVANGAYIYKFKFHFSFISFSNISCKNINRFLLLVKNNSIDIIGKSNYL